MASAHQRHQRQRQWNVQRLDLHRLHFGQRGDNGSIASDCSNENPEQDSKASISQANTQGSAFLLSLIVCRESYAIVD